MTKTFMYPTVRRCTAQKRWEHCTARENQALWMVADAFSISVHYLLQLPAAAQSGCEALKSNTSGVDCGAGFGPVQGWRDNTSLIQHWANDTSNRLISCFFFFCHSFNHFAIHSMDNNLKMHSQICLGAEMINFCTSVESEVQTHQSKLKRFCVHFKNKMFCT